MSQWAVSIAKLQENRSSEKETVTAIMKLRDQALLRFETNVTGATTGNGAFVTLWSATVPKNSTWNVTASVTGRGTTGGAAYALAGGVQDFAGVASVIGGGFPGITIIGEDAVAMNAKWDLTGSVLSLQVRDDAVQPMAWKAFVTALSSQ